MKTFIPIIIFLLFYLNTYAQTDKIGINTASPEETVHVIGDIILLESSDGTKKVMLRTEGASGEVKSLGDLYLRAQGNEVIINHVPTDGNVGIGKIGPTEMLDVEGAIRIGATSNMTSEGGTIKYEMGDFLGYDGSEWQSFTLGGGSSQWIGSAGSIYYNGRVGINTPDVNADLHVVGDSIRLQSVDGSKNLIFRNDGADSEVKSLGDLYLRGQNSNVIINHVSTDGNVGIGTSVATEKLSVGGAINLGTTSTNNEGSIRYTTADGFEGYDDTEWKSLTNGGGLWSEESTGIFFNEGNVSIGTAPGIGNKFEVFTLNNFNLGSFRNLGNISANHLGITSSLEGPGTGDKIAGEFKSIHGSGDNTGLTAIASGTGINKAIVATVPNAKDEDRAAHFTEGRVQINDRLGVGGFVLDNSKVNIHNQNVDSIVNGLIVYNNINTGSFAKGIDVGIVNSGQGDLIALDASAYGTNSSSGDMYGIKCLAEGPGTGDRYGVYSETGDFGAGDGYAFYAEVGDGNSPGYGVFSNTVHDNHFAFYGVGKSYLSKNLNLGGSSNEKSTIELTFDQSFGTPYNNSIRDGEILLNTIIAPEALEPGTTPVDFKDTVLVLGGVNEVIELHTRKKTSNSNSQLAIQIKSGEAGMKHGIVNLYNQHGNRTIKIDGQASTSDHAHITMWDGQNEESKIQINSNWGGLETPE